MYIDFKYKIWKNATKISNGELLTFILVGALFRQISLLLNHIYVGIVLDVGPAQVESSLWVCGLKASSFRKTCY